MVRQVKAKYHTFMQPFVQKHLNKQSYNNGGLCVYVNKATENESSGP